MVVLLAGVAVFPWSRGASGTLGRGRTSRGGNEWLNRLWWVLLHFFVDLLADPWPVDVNQPGLQDRKHPTDEKVQA